MSFLNKLLKNNKPESTASLKLSMILFPGIDSFSYKRFVEDVYQHYGYQIINEGNDDIAGAFTLKGISIGFMNMNFPVPAEDIEGTAQYAYNWETASKELENHQGHLILTMNIAIQNAVQCFKLQSEMISSVLRTTDAVGVYDGDQSLLISAADYLSEFMKMSDILFPLNLWIYFGLRTIEGKTNGYTYGLKMFGKKDMEILNSNLPLLTVRERLWNTTHYVLMNDVTFKDGQTLGYTMEEKIRITYSKAKFVEGYTFKLHY